MMTFSIRTVALLCLTAMAQASFASDTQTIGWRELLPEQRPYHDPFRDLDYEQISALANLFRIEVQEAGNNSPAMKEEAARLREDLAAEGLDPDWLFEQRSLVMNQRSLAASETNPDIIGKSIRMPGYMLPLEMTGRKTVEFLLVPTVGACIHSPPPPANQMVFVRFEEGFEMDGLYAPVWITGEIHAQNRTQSLSYVDGVADIETSYIMDALTVEAYE